MFKLARSLKVIETTAPGDDTKTFQIFIDGDEFPWFTTRGRLYAEEEDHGYTVYVPVYVADSVDLGNYGKTYKF